MKRIPLLFILLLAATPARADFSCTPESFTLDRTGHEGLRLKGALYVPVDGYT